MEACNDRQLSHRQLFRRFLVAVAVGALDFRRTAQILRLCEPLQTVDQRFRFLAFVLRLGVQVEAEVQRDVPERIDRGGYVAG